MTARNTLQEERPRLLSELPLNFLLAFTPNFPKPTCSAGSKTRESGVGFLKGYEFLSPNGV
jgi:hypothetical protein